MLACEGYLTAADGTRLYFQTFGDAPQALIIPNGFYLLDDFGWLADRRTLVVYDLRNGRSDTVTDAARLAGIRRDVDDLDAVRRHFGLEAVDLLGHSYVATMIAQFCELAWSELRRLYVVDEAHAQRIDWGRCELANERNFMQHWTQNIIPSLQAPSLTPQDYARVAMPFLIVHGRKDRSAPYGGGLDWAHSLPGARIVTVDEAAHAPWIEAPQLVCDSIAEFLSGRWPRAAPPI
jgi:pimeloyl-ACP methyl ester carboxylesterase